MIVVFMVVVASKHINGQIDVVRESLCTKIGNKHVQCYFYDLFV